MPNESAEPSLGPSTGDPPAHESLRATRRRYFAIIAVVAISSIGTDAVGLWSIGDRVRHHRWLLEGAIIVLPAAGLVVAGLIGWHIMTRSSPNRQLLMSGTELSHRQALANLRAGRTLTQQERTVVQALVDVHHPRRWVTWAFGGYGIFWVVLAFLDGQGQDLWFRLILGIVWLTCVPINWRTTHLLVRRAAAQGIQPSKARSTSPTSRVTPREHH